MTIIPVKINDGFPRNSTGQLISIAVKYADAIAMVCPDHHYVCKCQPNIKARKRWTSYLQKELDVVSQ